MTFYFFELSRYILAVLSRRCSKIVTMNNLFIWNENIRLLFLDEICIINLYYFSLCIFLLIRTLQNPTFFVFSCPKRNKPGFDYVDMETIIAYWKIQSNVAPFLKNPSKYCKNANYDRHSFGQKFGGQKFSADKIAENWAQCRKFCPSKIFVRRKFCPPNFCPIR